MPCCSSKTALPPGRFTQRALRPARLSPIEAVSPTIAIRRACSALFQRRDVGILELFGLFTWRFRDERKGMGDEDPRRRCDGDFSAYRNASHGSRALRLACAPESWQRIAIPGDVRHSDGHWIRALLRRGRKAALLDELDSFRRRIGVAVAFDPSHLAWETDKADGSAAKTSAFGREIEIAGGANFRLRTGA
jgi:hypothetical protein